MCTLTVVIGIDTYLMAMNRDEKIARGAGLPPEIHEFDGTRAIYPSDGQRRHMACHQRIWDHVCITELE